MGLCGSSEDANPMPDTILNWAGLFNEIEKRIKAKPSPTQPFYLVVLLECAEFKWSELKDPESKEAAYNLLEQALVDFHKAKEEEEEKEREEKKKNAKRKSAVFGDRDKLPESEMDEMMKKKQAGRLLKIVIRFMQRKLVMWNRELQKGEIKSTALKDRLRYACVDGEPPDDDDSDNEEDNKNADPATIGWIPSPKEDIRLDQMDTFLVADLDYFQLNSGDPVGLFFKLRYGCRAADMKQYEKAMQVVEKAQGLATEALNDLEREYAQKLAEEEKERQNNPLKPAQTPRGTKKEAAALIDPNQELRDVLLMCKTKLHIWHMQHHK